MDTTSLIPVYTAFGGIILGAVASFFPAYFLEKIKTTAEIKAVTGAIVTEIKVSVFIAEKRKYIEGIEKILAALRNKEITGSTYQIMVSDDYRPIFKSHLDKIGLIPQEIRDDVVTFYQLVDAALCDVRPGGLIATNLCGEREFKELHDISSEAIRIGKKIIAAYFLIDQD